MKKWLKWILGIVSIILIIFILYIAMNWSSFQILKGTEGISQGTAPIPEPVSEIPSLGERGASDWVSWYGPAGDHRSPVTGIITDWSHGLKKVWEIDYLCQGRESAAWSAPVIQGNRLVVCGRNSDSDLIFCLNPANGELIWHTSYPAKAKNNHGSGPRATPYIDGDRVYTFGRSGDLVCWNLIDGKKRWHVNVMEMGGEEPTWGHSSSPLVVDSLVIIQGGGDIRTVAFNKFSGETVWTSGKGTAGYAAPVLMKVQGKRLILAFHGTGLSALDFRNGKELWFVPWITSYDVNATTPLVINDQIFITSGYGTGALLLKTDGSTVDSLWQIKEISSQHSDPYCIDGYLYGYSGDSYQNKGAFKCIDLSNGKVMWSTNDMGWGTCTWVDGYLICSDIKGSLFLMKPSPEAFNLIGTFNDALGDVQGPVWTKPIITGNYLYLRFKQKLVCYYLISAEQSS